MSIVRQDSKDSEICEQCSFCGKSTIKECSGCGWTFYCSRECQEQHWSIHREFCNSEYEGKFEKLEGMRVVACQTEQMQRREEMVQSCVIKARGKPCCAICGDTCEAISLKRFAGILICNDCVELQGKM